MEKIFIWECKVLGIERFFVLSKGKTASEARKNISLMLEECYKDYNLRGNLPSIEVNDALTTIFMHFSRSEEDMLLLADVIFILKEQLREPPKKILLKDEKCCFYIPSIRM